MVSVFMAYLDQFRAVTGLFAAHFMFCRHAVPRRERFGLRLAACYLICLSLGFAYVPVEPMLAALPTVLYGISSASYWIVITALVCVAVYQCYEISVLGALFRSVLGNACETIVTTILRYLVVMMWLPDLPERNPALYILLSLAIYSSMYFVMYRLLAKPLQRGGIESEGDRSFWGVHGFLLLTLALIIYATNGICEWVVPSMGSDPALDMQYRLIQYFCIGIRLLVATAFIVNQSFIYYTNILQYERDMVSQLLKEKSAQYEFNRENIEFIRQKCHDLKRQLRALELAGDDERRAVLEETRRAAEFYDANIHTGHPVLDTLLTEKSLLCTNRGIQFSCAVSVREMGDIGNVDLYTMLSNAIDNAIEGVERLEDPEMKTISFTMAVRGRMLCVEIENYYAGVIEMRDGLPATSKTDKANHGIGTRSIRTLAHKYGGEIRITTENRTFLLQIAIPLSN